MFLFLKKSSRSQSLITESEHLNHIGVSWKEFSCHSNLICQKLAKV